MKRAVDDEPADVRAHVPGDSHGAGGETDEGVCAGEADDEAVTSVLRASAVFPPAQPQHGVGDFAGAPGFVEDLPHGDAEQG